MIETPEDPVATIRKLMVSGDYAALIRIAEGVANILDNDETAFCVALSHIHLGERSAAEAILTILVTRSPRYFEAKAALCKLLIIDGREAESRDLFLTLEGDAKRDARAAHMLGDVYLQAKRIPDAHRIFSMLKRNTGSPSADLGLAETFLRVGLAGEAIAAAQRAVASLGFQPAVLQVLGPAALCVGDAVLVGRCLQELEGLPRPIAVALFDLWTDVLVAACRLPEACFACQRLVELAASPERLRLLSELKLSNRDLDGAIEAANRACALDPKDAHSHVALARCRIAAGDVVSGVALLKHALALDPTCVGGYDYLSQCDPKQIDAVMRGRMAAMLQGSVKLSAADRPGLGLAIGRTAEANGDYQGAFGCYLAAKREIALVATAAGRGYDPVATESGLRHLIAAFSGNLHQSNVKASTCVRPIFIVGMPRSGTSLIEQVLSCHPDVFGAGELPTMVDALGALVRHLVAGASAQKIIDDHGQVWIERYSRALPDASIGKVWITDKHPLNFWSIGLIAALLPDAQFIHVSRNSLDTCISIFKQRFSNDYTFAHDIDALAHYYVAYERMMAHWQSVFPTIIEVRYEKFVTAFEPETHELLAACGLPWSDACLEFHQAKRAVFTHSAAQVRAPVSGQAVERWRKFGDSIRPLQMALDRYRAS